MEFVKDGVVYIAYNNTQADAFIASGYELKNDAKKVESENPSPSSVNVKATSKTKAKK